MNNFYALWRSIFIYVFLFFSLTTFAQVGIGNTTPHESSLLDISDDAKNKGVLIPRVSIENLGNKAPITSATIEESLIVYNTNTITGKGFYYWDGDKWVRIAATSDASDDWKLIGNAGTNANNNFIGTTDSKPLRINTNNNERIRILSNGQVAINQTTAVGNSRLTVIESGSNRGVFGNSSSGEGIRGEATSGEGVVGITSTGNGVLGASLSVGFGGRFIGQHNNAVGALIRGGNQAGLVFPNSGTGATITGRNFGTTSFASAFNGEGVVGVGDNLGGLPPRPLGVGVVGFGYDAGVFGDSGYYGKVGVYGRAEGSPLGSNSGIGVYGENAGGLGDGVLGNSTNIGVRGFGAHGGILESEIDEGFGVIAWNTAGSGDNRTGLIAVGQNLDYLTFEGTGAILFGRSSGGSGWADNSDGTGLVGVGNSLIQASGPQKGAGVAGTGASVGVYGKANTGSDPIGVIGVGNNIGTYIVPSGNLGAGVAGTGLNIGVYGHATDENGFGVYSSGDFHATGTITSDQPIVVPRGIVSNGFIIEDGNLIVENTINSHTILASGNLTAGGTKNFIIDDPRDPANKYLKHASIESNEILNLYRGVNTFDSSGEVVVQLPDYYDAINRNASYQLTSIGAAMPNIHIAKEVKNGVFVIAGGVPGKKVSWVLTAERNDPYIRNNPENRIMVVDKGSERGLYLTPEAYGQSADKGILNNKISGIQNKTNFHLSRNSVGVKEMQSQTLEASKLNREEVLTQTISLKEQHDKNSETKEMRNVKLIEANEVKILTKSEEVESSSTLVDEVEPIETQKINMNSDKEKIKKIEAKE